MILQQYQSLEFDPQHCLVGIFISSLLFDSECPISLSLSYSLQTARTQRIFEQKKGTKKVSSSPKVAHHPSSQLLTILGHKASQKQTCHYLLSTTYLSSLLQFQRLISLALISRTKELTREFLISAKPVLFLFQFSIICLTVAMQ